MMEHTADPNGHPFPGFLQSLPVLETPRLILRPMQKTDAEDMYAYAHLPQVTQYLLWDTHPDLRHTRRYLASVRKAYRRGCFFDWAIVRRQDGRMIGTCGFSSLSLANRRGEIGYVLHPDCWGQGLAAEAAKAVLSLGFGQLGLCRIEGRYMTENQSSRRVMDKLGMQFEGIARQALFCKGRLRDIGVCSILREEFRQA